MGENYGGEFKLLYQTELDKEVMWLKIGAIEKSNSIECLLKKNNIYAESILELGCGVGALLNECCQRGIASSFFGVDYSLDAIFYIRTHLKEITAIEANIIDPEFFLDGRYDILVISHVLEHLEDPNILLNGLNKKINFKYLIVEVPLENLFFQKILHRKKNRNNKAGHVNFFDIQSFEKLLSTSGFNIIDARNYLPILDYKSLKFICMKDKKSRINFFQSIVTSQLSYIFKPLWKKYVYSHLAVLCRNNENSDEAEPQS